MQITPNIFLFLSALKSRDVISATIVKITHRVSRIQWGSFVGLGFFGNFKYIIFKPAKRIKQYLFNIVNFFSIKCLFLKIERNGKNTFSKIQNSWKYKDPQIGLCK